MGSRRMNVFLGASVAALVVIVGLPGRGPADAAPPTTFGPPTPGGPPELDLSRPRGLDVGSLSARLEALRWGRNPFAAPVREVSPVAQRPEDADGPTVALPRLVGVSRGARGDLAILDEEVLALGDRTADGFLVHSIQAGQVTLLLDGRQHVLSLAGNP